MGLFLKGMDIIKISIYLGGIFKEKQGGFTAGFVQLKAAARRDKMDLDALKSLVAVKETGSFSKAANKLCVSQSAVSKRIKQLEENLGLLLLDRQGPVLQLTDAGKIVHKNALLIMDTYSNCRKELVGLCKRSKLNFCCTPSFGTRYVPKITHDFMQLHPVITNYNFSLANIEKIMEGLQNNSFQLAVVEHCDVLPFRGKVLEQLADDTLIWVGSPSLNLPSDCTVINELFQFDLYIRSSGCCSRQTLEAKLAKYGCSVEDFNKVLVYDDLNMMIQSILSGTGIAYLARNVVQEFIDAGKLMRVYIPEFEQSLYRSLVAGADYTASPCSDDLIDIILKIAK